MNSNRTASRSTRLSRWLLVVDVIGLFIFLASVRPGVLGLYQRPGFGYLKISGLLLGLAMITLASYGAATLRRRAGRPPSLMQDVGARLMATGYVLAAFSSLADLLGLGSVRFPSPYPMQFGLVRSLGLFLGVLIILIGLILNSVRGNTEREPRAGPPKG